jgi:Ca2+-binding RTX toxin-like protein
VVALDTGGFALAYTEAGYLKVRAYGADGAPATEPLQLPTLIFESLRSFDLVDLGGGRVMVGWIQQNEPRGVVVDLQITGVVRGTEFADILEGGPGDDHLFGLAGNDELRGGPGNDRLEGGDGVDILSGGAGNDIIDGGANTDSVDYRDKTVSVVLALAGAQDAVAFVGGVAEDIVRNVEQIFGGSAADTLHGDAGRNFINGAGGNDIIRGGGGNDTLIGSLGLDLLDYRDKTASVVLTLNGATNAIATVGGVAEDTVNGFESVYGGSAADTLTGDAFANLFRGGGGADIIDGAGGVDSVDFRDKTRAVVLTLDGANNATATVGGVSEDTVRNIENVYGGTAADRLTGDALANQLFGGGGDDVLIGLGGRDVLTGGGGADRFTYVAVSDSTIATSRSDVITDFRRADGDRIDLSIMDAVAATSENDAFVFIGAAGFTSGTPGQVRAYYNAALGGMVVQGETTGDGVADFQILLTAPGDLGLLSTDFVL